jgi:hypothetical protein
MNRQMRSAKGFQKVWEETKKIIQKNVEKQNIIKE